MCRLVLVVLLLPAGLFAQVAPPPPRLKHYDVTVVRFDPARGPAAGERFVLPVDSPDEEHAIASTLANAASWGGKVADGQPRPIAFMAVQVTPR